MKVMKKSALVVAALSLTVGLSACGNQGEDTKSTSSKEKNEPTITDILNSDKERMIVMTEDTGNTESPQVRWAGVIGKGKLDAHPYYYKDDLELDDFKNMSMKEFKDRLKEEDESYKSLDDDGKEKEIKYGPRKAGTKVVSENGENKAEKIAFDINRDKLGNEEDENAIAGPKYSKIPESKTDGWLSMQTKDAEDISGQPITPFVLNIKAGKNEEKLSFENVKKAEKEYDNVKVVKSND